MTICPNTGITLPECSCRSCLQAQIERHMPALLGVAAPSGEQPTGDFLAVPPDRARIRTIVRQRLSRLRRAA